MLFQFGNLAQMDMGGGPGQLGASNIADNMGNMQQQQQFMDQSGMMMPQGMMGQPGTSSGGATNQDGAQRVGVNFMH